MIPYLLYVATLLAICWIFYKLFLQRETFYRLNRWVLLSCLGICFLLPLFKIPQKWKITHLVTTQPIVQPVKTTVVIDTVKSAVIIARADPQILQKQLPVVSQAPEQPIAKTDFHISFTDIMKWLMIVYWAGVIVFGINLLIQLIYTFYQAYAKQAIIDSRYRIVDITGDKIPCSFLNTIFINPEKYDWDTYNQILTHEKIHIKQLHSLDILLAEVAILFQWFNPFAWLLRKEIENNLEYLTDKEVLNDDTIDPSLYQMSLLKVSAPHLSLRITTNYNQSLLRKRINMMNAKKSNIHTLWKYLVLLPLFGGLACALNQSVASEPSNLKINNPFRKAVFADTLSYTETNGKIEGLWFATQKHDTIAMEFKTSTQNHTWNDGGDFAVREFTSIPEGKKGTFTVVRDGGTMVLNGSFDGDGGLGHFKFTPNKKYIAYLSTIQAGKFNEHDVMNLMTTNVSTAYLRAVAENGYTNIKANTFAGLKYFKVSEADLYYWKHSGVKDITDMSLISAKINKIDSNYVRSIQKLGYKDITFQQLTILKSQNITPDYIKSLSQARQSGKNSEDAASNGTELSEIINAKYEKLDSTYISSIEACGYNLTQQQLSQFKGLGITADYIKGIKQLGYNPSYNEVISYKNSKITPEFIKTFKDIGYENISYSELFSLKYQNVTPEYIHSFESLGYKNLPLQSVLSFKAQNITTDYIAGFNKLGYTNIPTNDLVMLKLSGVTPQYVSSMKQKGLESKDLHKYITLKNSFKDSD